MNLDQTDWLALLKNDKFNSQLIFAASRLIELLFAFCLASLLLRTHSLFGLQIVVAFVLSPDELLRVFFSCYIPDQRLFYLQGNLILLLSAFFIVQDLLSLFLVDLLANYSFLKSA